MCVHVCDWIVIYVTDKSLHGVFIYYLDRDDNNLLYISKVLYIPLEGIERNFLRSKQWLFYYCKMAINRELTGIPQRVAATNRRHIISG